MFQTLNPPDEGREEIGVYPCWGLPLASLVDLPPLDAFTFYDTVASPHDYWWPVLRGARDDARALVLEDTRGVTAARLTRHCAEVVACFDSEEDAAMLRQCAHLMRNLRIIVDPAPWKSAALAGMRADILVWQRPSRHLRGLGIAQRAAAEDSLRSMLVPGGGMLADDSVAAPAPVQWISKREAEHARTAYTIADLRRVVRGGDVYVGARPLRRWNWPVAEVTRRRSRTTAGAALEGLTRRGLNRRTVRRFMVPGKAVVIAPREASLLSQALRHPAILAEVGGEPEIRKLFSGVGEITIALIGRRGDDGTRVVLRFACRDTSLASLERSRRALTVLSAGPLAGLVPKLLCAESCEGGSYTAESFLVGRPITSLEVGPEKDRAHVNAMRVMYEFKRPLLVNVMFDRAIFHEHLGAGIARLRQYAPADCRPALDQVAALLESRIVGRAWPLVPLHGDFKAGNVLVDRAGEVSGIIDWDMWHERGLPLLDVLALCAFDWSVESGLDFGPGILADMLHGTWRAHYEELVTKSAGFCGLDAEQTRVMRAAFWLRHVVDRVSPVMIINRSSAREWLDEPLRLLARELAA